MTEPLWLPKGSMDDAEGIQFKSEISLLKTFSSGNLVWDRLFIIKR